MKAKIFITELEGYYGRYQIGQRKYVEKWVDNFCLRSNGEYLLPYLLSEVFRSFSASFKSQPGIKELEDAWKIVLNERRLEIIQTITDEQKLVEEEPIATPEEAQRGFNQINEILKKYKGDCRCCDKC